MVKQKKLLKDYDAYIVDVDGTLYFKRPMQIKMAFGLALFYFFHVTKLKELLLLRDYRKMRDKEEVSGNDNFESVIIRELSDKYNYSEERINSIIEKWIFEKPLSVLYKCRDKQLISMLAEQRKQGKKVFIYSDYPAEDKCAVFGVYADGIYWPDQKRIYVLKPSPDGVRYILNENRLDKSSTVFIGDRYEKDGKCAESAGLDYLVLENNRFKRVHQYNFLRRKGEF